MSAQYHVRALVDCPLIIHAVFFFFFYFFLFDARHTTSHFADREWNSNYNARCHSQLHSKRRCAYNEMHIQCHAKQVALLSIYGRPHNFHVDAPRQLNPSENLRHRHFVVTHTHMCCAIAVWGSAWVGGIVLIDKIHGSHASARERGSAWCADNLELKDRKKEIAKRIDLNSEKYFNRKTRSERFGDFTMEKQCQEIRSNHRAEPN